MIGGVYSLHRASLCVKLTKILKSYFQNEDDFCAAFLVCHKVGTALDTSE